ncbi:hypothetical protein ACFP8W_18560, partial [Nocardioides hankookensis]
MSHESDNNFDETRPIERSPQPPAYDPYGNPYQDPYAAPAQQVAPHPAPAAAHRAGWSWRSS